MYEDKQFSLLRFVLRVIYGVCTFFSMLISPVLFVILVACGLIGFSYGAEFIVITALYMTLLGYGGMYTGLIWIVSICIVWSVVEYIKSRLIVFAR
jgi:hypothetical protein